MKIKTGTIIKRLNGKPVMVDQEPILDNETQVGMTSGREMTVGDVISTILTTKKVEQFNTLKAYALAQRFYRSEVTDLDDTDFTAMRDIVEKNDQYVPLVLAQVLQVLIDAKDLHSPQSGEGQRKRR